MKILTIVGARPQFIKLGPVSQALRQAGHEEILLHTGQHYDAGMSDVFFDELGLAAPDICLGVGSKSHAAQTAEMLLGIEQAILTHTPDCVLIFGDTNSTLAGALAAAKLHVPIAHVEAGLRSFNRRMPEEINRIVADAVSDVLLAPTSEAFEHLQREGARPGSVYLVGDVMYDAALIYGERAEQKSKVIEKFGLDAGKYILATIHRAENTDDADKAEIIFEGLKRLAERSVVILPLHPRTRGVLERARLLENVGQDLMVVEPVGYLDMVKLEKNAALIVTDSGGVQKEAFFHRVPCVTLRGETEWVELIELGWNVLCPPTSAQVIVDAVCSRIGVRGREASPYGSGRASQEIVRVLRNTI